MLPQLLAAALVAPCFSHNFQLFCTISSLSGSPKAAYIARAQVQRSCCRPPSLRTSHQIFTTASLFIINKLTLHVRRSGIPVADHFRFVHLVVGISGAGSVVTVHLHDERLVSTLKASLNEF